LGKRALKLEGVLSRQFRRRQQRFVTGPTLTKTAADRRTMAGQSQRLGKFAAEREARAYRPREVNVTGPESPTHEPQQSSVSGRFEPGLP
jgi:hypothetical protein